MTSIGIFFAAFFGLGVVGVLAVMAVNRFREKDRQARRSLRAQDYDSHEMYGE